MCVLMCLVAERSKTRGGLGIYVSTMMTMNFVGHISMSLTVGGVVGSCKKKVAGGTTKVGRVMRNVRNNYASPKKGEERPVSRSSKDNALDNIVASFFSSNLDEGSQTGALGVQVQVSGKGLFDFPPCPVLFLPCLCPRVVSVKSGERQGHVR